MDIIKYSNKFEGYFRILWVNWLKNATGKEPEPEDIFAVDNPVDTYIDTGGMVYFALIKETPVGVVAIKKLGKGNFEFCKLLVTEEARGLGLGKLLVGRCIEFVYQNHGKALYLQSINQLKIALKMYREMGFVNATPPQGMTVLKRTEIIMKISNEKMHSLMSLKSIS